MRNGTRTLLTVASLTLLPVIAYGQGSELTVGATRKLVSCLRIEAPMERLDCYDEVVDRLSRMAEPGGPEGESLVESFVGADDWDSPVLEMKRSWHVAWRTETNILTIELRGTRGEHLTVVGHQIGSGTGQSDPIEPGVYRLALRGFGDWRIDVVEEAP